MEHYMRAHMTDDIVARAAFLYGVDPSVITFLGGFENFVYEFQTDDRPCILRFVHCNHRPFHHVLAELEFIDYLHEHNACVSTVVHSIHNNIVERIEIDEDHYFTIAVFEKAPGTFVKEEDLSPDLWANLGREIGRMHRLTKTFKPKHKRPHWYEENFEDIAVRVLEEDDKDILTLYTKVKKRILSFPTTTDNYGLIHTDLHFHNMYYHHGTFTFFDFDDAAYKHFLSDIAIVLYYFHMGMRKDTSNDTVKAYNKSVKSILHWFVSGYEKENHFDRNFCQYLNDFLLLRSVVLYIVLVAAGYKHHEEEGYRRFCQHAKTRAVEHTMKLDLDFVLDGL